MTTSTQTGVTFLGLDAEPVDVSVRLRPGASGLSIHGLADAAAADTTARLRSALAAIGLALPVGKIVVTVTPPDVTIAADHYDLPIALGLLTVQAVLDAESLMPFLALGRLTADGTLAPVRGVLAAALAASAAEKGLICPAIQGGEAAWGAPSAVIAPVGLPELINHFHCRPVLPRPVGDVAPVTSFPPDLADVRGLETARRALEVAAGGGHSILITGPSGAGKSMLARRLPPLLPPLTATEALEVSLIHSMAGRLDGGRMRCERPVQAAAPGTRAADVVEDQGRNMPGLLSLAHRGVLLLDDLPNVDHAVLTAVGDALRCGRAGSRFPAEFQLVATASTADGGSGIDALIDFIDIHVEITPVPATPLPPGETSAAVATRIAALARHDDAEGKPAVMTASAETLLTESAKVLHLSKARCRRVTEVARTIARMDGRTRIDRVHLAEAVGLCPRRPKPPD